MQQIMRVLRAHQQQFESKSGKEERDLAKTNWVCNSAT